MSLAGGPSREGLPGPAVRLLERLDALGGFVAFERSFKILPGALLEGRLLAGIRLEGIEAAHVAELATAMAMPGGLRARFLEGLREADNLLVGYEGDEERGLFKAYLEHTRRFDEIALGRRSLDEPFVLHTGFKWDPGDAARATGATYTCFPGSMPDDMLHRIGKLHFARSRRGFGLACDVIEKALERPVTHPFLYMEVAEEGNVRRSFDVNMYGARMKLNDLDKIWRKMFASFGLEGKRLESILAAHGELAFGHLSGGTERHGREFFTVYYGDRRAFMRGKE